MLMVGFASWLRSWSRRSTYLPRKSDSKSRTSGAQLELAYQPGLFMTLRREITKPRRETGARSLEDLRRTRTVHRGSEGRARWPQACRNSGSAIAAEWFMNNAGEIRPATPIARYLNIALIGLLTTAPPSQFSCDPGLDRGLRQQPRESAS
jgi:hypothetical protein